MMIVGAVLVAMLWARPHRELDWKETIVPLARQFANRNSDNNNSQQQQPLNGIVVVITGATSGIGLALTHAFSELGASIVAVGRSPSKLKRLQRQYPTTIHSVWAMDLANLTDVAHTANQILSSSSSLDHIDILVNNAGTHAKFNVWSPNAAVEPDIYDKVFVVNYLSHFLWTEKLLPLLKSSSAAQPVIAQTSSSYHWAVDGSDLTVANTSSNSNDIPVAARVGGSRGLYVFRTQRSYANSKLAQIYHARSLKRQGRIEHQEQQSNSNKNGFVVEPRIVNICPGWVATNIAGPKDSILVFLLAKVAFPKHGWGISSALHAILEPSRNSGDDDDNGNDYYINSDVFRLGEYLFPRPTPAWMYQFGLRDVIGCVFSSFALLTQNLAAHAVSVQSSPESYNGTTAQSLYEWSQKAISTYL